MMCISFVMNILLKVKRRRCVPILTLAFLSLLDRLYEIRPPGTGSHPPKKLVVLCNETRQGSHRVKRGELDRELERQAEELLASADDSDVEEAVDISADDPEVVSIGDDGEDYKVPPKDDDGEWEDWRKFAALEAREKEAQEEEDDDDEVMIIEPSSSTAPRASSSSAASGSAAAKSDAPSSPSSVATLSPIGGPSRDPTSTREAEANASSSPSSHSKASWASASASSAVSGRRASAPSLPPPFAMDDESDWEQGAGKAHLKDLETDSEGHIEADDTEESQGGESCQAGARKSGPPGSGGGAAGSQADGKRKAREPMVVDLTEEEEAGADEGQREEAGMKRRTDSGGSGSEGEGGGGKRYKREREEGNSKESQGKSGGQAVGLRYDRELGKFVSVPVCVDADAAAAHGEKKAPASQEQGKGGEGVTSQPAKPPTAARTEIDLTEDDD